MLKPIQSELSPYNSRPNRLFHRLHEISTVMSSSEGNERTAIIEDFGLTRRL